MKSTPLTSKLTVSLCALVHILTSVNKSCGQAVGQAWAANWKTTTRCNGHEAEQTSPTAFQSWKEALPRYGEVSTGPETRYCAWPMWKSSHPATSRCPDLSSQDGQKACLPALANHQTITKPIINLSQEAYLIILKLLPFILPRLHWSAVSNVPDKHTGITSTISAFFKEQHFSKYSFAFVVAFL